MPESQTFQEFIPFRFRVSLFAPQAEGSTEGSRRLLCQGAFSEVTGLEATMAPKAHKEGGRNWGDVQLSGPTTFAPVVLKRGITSIADLWEWFEATTRQAQYDLRYTGVIEVFHPSQAWTDTPALTWELEKALPTKFKGPDLSATSSQVAVEELHLVHEGLTLVRPR